MQDGGQENSSPTEKSGDEENPEEVQGGAKQPAADADEWPLTADDEDYRDLKEDFERGLVTGRTAGKKLEEIEFQVPSEEALEEEFGPRVGESGESAEFTEDEPGPPTGRSRESEEDLEEDFGRRLFESRGPEEALDEEKEAPAGGRAGGAGVFWPEAGKGRRGRKLTMTALASILVMTALGAFLYNSGYLSDWRSLAPHRQVRRASSPEAPVSLPPAEADGPAASMGESLPAGDAAAPSVPATKPPAIQEEPAVEKTALENLFIKARNHVKNKDFQKAEGIYLGIIQGDPQSGQAHFALGDIYLERGEYEKAEEMFKKANSYFGRNRK